MTRVLSAALALTMFSGCPADGPTEDTDPQCLITYTMFPEADARAYYRTTVDAVFSEAVTGATLVVTDADGEVAGSAAIDEKNDKRLVFTPSTPLTPGATYTAAVEFPCAGSTQGGSVTWTVSEVGSPIGDVNSLVGNDYALSLASARFIRPDAVGDIIGDFLTFDILVSVKEVDSTSLTVFGAVGDEETPGKQATCSPTIDFPSADFTENPYFELGPQQLSISVQDTDVTIEELFLAGSFAPDGSYIDGVVLAGIVDTRPFAPLIEDDPDAPPEAVCEVTGRLGIPCIQCPDNSGEYCLEILADSISATSDGVDDVQEIPDICALEECQDEDECK